MHCNCSFSSEDFLLGSACIHQRLLSLWSRTVRQLGTFLSLKNKWCLWRTVSNMNTLILHVLWQVQFMKELEISLYTWPQFGHEGQYFQITSHLIFITEKLCIFRNQALWICLIVGTLEQLTDVFLTLAGQEYVLETATQYFCGSC